MPKLKKVDVKENSMSWEDVTISEQSRKKVISIPKRELNIFLEKGKKIKKIIVEFS